MIQEYLQPVQNLQARFRSGTFRLCELGLPDLHFRKVLSSKHKNSASNSIIIIAEAFEQDVVAKITFDSNIKEDNSLSVEAYIYSHIVPVLQKRSTPNLMTFLGYGTCGNFGQTSKDMSTADVPHAKEFTSRSQDNCNKKRREIQLWPSESHSHEKKPVVKPLGEWLQSEWYGWNSTEREAFISDVLLQVAYTLLVFEDIGLMHNDLHTGNVFVEELEQPLNLSFGVTDEKSVSRDVSFFVRLFDFDHSAKVPTIHWDITVYNSLLATTMCRYVGECNNFRRNADWFTVLHFMYKITKYQNLETIVNQQLLSHGIVHKDPFTGKPLGNATGLLAHMGHACQCTNNTCDACDPMNLNDPKTDYFTSCIYSTTLCNE